MDYRCPICRETLIKRKLSHAIVARMELDCTHCKKRIRLNVHWVEELIVLLAFALFLVLAAFAYWSQNQGLLLFAFGAAMVSGLVLPLLDKTYLRTWPRYATLIQPGKDSTPKEPHQ